MKRNAQMQRAGVPSAGTKPIKNEHKKAGFKGWRRSSKQWREGMPLIDTRHHSDLSLAELSDYRFKEKTAYKFHSLSGEYT